MAIISACRVEEIQALMAGLLYTIFHRDKVSIRPHPRFLRKVPSDLHINQNIHLPIFFPKPHASDSERKFHSFYLDRII